MSDSERRWLGSWWRPGRARAEELGGELELDPEEGLSLTIFGTLAGWANEGDPENTVWLSAPAREHMIHGYADGVNLTLLNSDCSSPRMPMAYGSESWRPEAAIEGHLTSGGQSTVDLFIGIRFKLQQLPTWVEAVGPDCVFDWSDKRALRVDVSAQAGELIAFTLDSGETISIFKGLATEGSTEGLRREIRQPVYFDVRVADPASWFDLANQWLQPIQALLWLATGRAGEIEGIWLMPSSLAPREEPWKRLWAPLLQPTRLSREPIGPEVLFRAKELPGGLEDGFKAWLTLWEDLRHLLGPLYARTLPSFVYSNDRFYTAIVALEEFHRIRDSATRDLPRQDHKARVERLGIILEEHAPDLKEWAVNAAKPFNSVPLQRRVAELIAASGGLGEVLFGEHAVFFATCVEAARHAHSHGTKKSHPLLEEPAGLYLASDALVWLLRSAIMVQLGFESTLVVERICAHPRVQWLGRQVVALLDRCSRGAGSGTATVPVPNG